MDFEPILTFVEMIVYNTTGNYLTELQKSIIIGSLMKKTYLEISEDLGYTEGYVKDEGSRLWKIMSHTLGEDIKKSNLHSRLKNWQLHLHLDNSFNNLQNSTDSINNLNICSSISTGKESDSPLSNTPLNFSINLYQMPCLKVCDGRLKEVNFWQQQILESQPHLLAITGICGIGKSTLVVQLVEEIKDKFNYIIWCNLSLYPTLQLLLKDLVNFLSQSNVNLTNDHDLLTELKSYLVENKCLIILDQGESIFEKCQLAGSSKNGYENFRELVNLIVNINHQSTVIFSSKTLSKSMINLFNDDETFTCLLELESLGLSCQEIIKKYSNNEQLYPTLIDKYSGNPLWLKIICRTIKELFNGDIEFFLEHDILPDDLAYLLTKEWEVLTELEQNILTLIATSNQTVSLDYLLNNITVSRSSLFNAVQSLLRRKLLIKILDNNSYNWTTLPVIHQFINELNY